MVSDYGLLPLEALKETESKGGDGGGGNDTKSKDKTREAPASIREEATAEMLEAAGQAWVAPEVQDGEPHSQHSDLFSYGGVLFEVKRTGGRGGRGVGFDVPDWTYTHEKLLESRQCLKPGSLRAQALCIFSFCVHQGFILTQVLFGYRSVLIQGMAWM